MTILLSHTPHDEPLIRDISAWLDAHQHAAQSIAVPDDASLIDQLRLLAPGAADRVLVALSPQALRTAWMRRDIFSGALDTFAQQCVTAEQCVKMILLQPCEVPLMLHDHIAANFANKPFDAACQELLNTLSGSTDDTTSPSAFNRIFRTWNVSPVGTGAFALVLEIGVSMARTLGLYIEVDAGAEYTFTKDWFGPPNSPTIPSRPGGPFFNSELRRRPPLYLRKFSRPMVTPSQSYYLYIEANEPLHVQRCLIADAFGRTL